MKHIKKRVKINNQGLTLMELIVTIAIIGIFGVVVMSFVTSGANFYRQASDTSTVQRNMQMTLDQIENLVMDTNKSIRYSVGGQATQNDLGSQDRQEKILILESVQDDSQQHKDILRWHPDEKKLYCNYNSDRATDEKVMAENVSAFSVDISQAVSDGIVRFQLTIQKRDKEITQTYTVTLRNQLGAES